MGRKSFGRLLLSGLALFGGIAALAIQGVHQPTKLEADEVIEHAINSEGTTYTLDFETVKIYGNYGLNKDTFVESSSYNYGYSFALKGAKSVTVTAGSKDALVLGKTGETVSHAMIYNTNNDFLKGSYISNITITCSSKMASNDSLLISVGDQVLESDLVYVEGSASNVLKTKIASSATISLDFSIKTAKYFQIENYNDKEAFISKVDVTYSPVDANYLCGYREIEIGNAGTMNSAPTEGEQTSFATTNDIVTVNRLGTSSNNGVLRLHKNQMLHFQAKEGYSIQRVLLKYYGSEYGNSFYVSNSPDFVDTANKYISNSSNVTANISTLSNGFHEFKFQNDTEDFSNVYIQNTNAERSSNYIQLAPTKIYVWAEPIMNAQASLGTTSDNNENFIRFEGLVMSSFALNNLASINDYGFKITYNGKTVTRSYNDNQGVSALYSVYLQEPERYSFVDTNRNGRTSVLHYYIFGFILEGIPTDFTGTFSYMPYIKISGAEFNPWIASNSIVFTNGTGNVA